MHWFLKTFPLCSNDALLQKTTFTFDASVWEFFAPILSGARLVVARPDGHMDMQYLINTIVSKSITVLQMVPSVLQILAGEPAFCQCTSLSRLFSGGEPLHSGLSNRIHESLDVSIYNLYGPTEATIDSTYSECLPLPTLSSLPIGKPIDNVHTYVLDDNLSPVPIGIPGELYVSGPSLANSYLNCAALTATSFIPNPFENRERLYRTGDIVRWTDRGDLEYITRRDNQIKIRGNRIELGEIESSLRKHPGIKGAHVTLYERDSSERSLIAYIIRESALDIDNLRTFLASILPSYMIPAHIIELDSFPLTKNGKIDRFSLPSSDMTAITEDRYTAPRTDIESELVKIWQEVLRLERVGINDNFFEIGGDSILSIQLFPALGVSDYC